MVIGIKKLTEYYKKKKETDPNYTKYKITKTAQHYISSMLLL
jgi:hypothetical protein